MKLVTTIAELAGKAGRGFARLTGRVLAPARVRAADAGRTVAGGKLDRCIPKCPKDGVDAGLVAGALSLKPLQHVLINPQRN